MADHSHSKASTSLQPGGRVASSSTIDGSREEWRKQCTKFERVQEAWWSGQIDQSLLWGRTDAPRSFRIKREIKEKVFLRKVDEIERVRDLTSCDRSEYANCLELLLDAEELHEAVEMRKHDILNKRLSMKIQRDGQMDYGFNLPDGLWWSHDKDFVIVQGESGFAMAMHIFRGTQMYIPLPRGAKQKFGIELRRPVSILFLSFGTIFGWQQMAIQNLRSSETLQRLVFEECGTQRLSEVKIDVARTNTQKLDERLQKLDSCQRESVIGILEARCRPKPYVVFGPPGTGKTHTLVEAIVQVYKRTRNLPEKAEGFSSAARGATLEHADVGLWEFARAWLTWFRDVATDFLSGVENSPENFPESPSVPAKILVCVDSYFCTTEMFWRLKRELPNANISILNTENVSRDCYDSEIIVTTTMKSGHFMDQYWFDYIFMDEANRSRVTQSLVPACLLKPDGCLVLAGDPRQLGPIVMCQQASDLGLGQSLLERVLTFKIYQRDQRSGEYDHRYITMLRDCYRSDARILSVSNRLFYGNELRCATETPRGLLEILRLTGPLQMRHVEGEQVEIPGSNSLYNQAEVEVCVDLIERLYFMGVRPSQIGVICLHTRQATSIREFQAQTLEADDSTIKTTLDQRFDPFSLAPIWKVMGNEDGLSSGLIEQHALAEGLKLYKQAEDEFFEECDVQALPEDLEKLFVRPKATSCDLRCKIVSGHGLQSLERDILIISTVLTQPDDADSLREISDPRRFNLAISRAKWLVIVVGNRDVLERAEYWRELLADAKTELDAWPENVDCTDPFSQRPLFHAR